MIEIQGLFFPLLHCTLWFLKLFGSWNIVFRLPAFLRSNSIGFFSRSHTPKYSGNVFLRFYIVHFLYYLGFLWLRDYLIALLLYCSSLHVGFRAKASFWRGAFGCGWLVYEIDCVWDGMVWPLLPSIYTPHHRPSTSSIYEPISIYTVHPHIHVHYILCRDNSHPLQAIFIPFRDYYPLSIHQGYLAYIRIFTQKKWEK